MLAKCYELLISSLVQEDCNHIGMGGKRNMEVEKFEQKRIYWLKQELINEVNDGEIQKIDIITSYNNARRPLLMLRVEKTYVKDSIGEKYGTRNYDFDCDEVGLDSALGDLISTLVEMEPEFVINAKKDKVPWVQSRYTLEVK